MSEYPYIINYQYATFWGCRFDFVKGKTLDEARGKLSERNRLEHKNLQVLCVSKEIEIEKDDDIYQYK